MGFLKDMLNPKKAFKETLNPKTHIKNTVAAFKSGDIKRMLDPADMYNKIGPGGKYGFGDSGSAIKTDPRTMGGAPGAYDPSILGADLTDPAYGSLTKPFDVEEFYKYQDPGYNFELQQGTQALQNAASAGSGAFSGAALKDLLQFSQGFARTGYNDAFNRYQVQQGNIFSRLSDIAHLGQNAAAGVGSQGTALAGSAGQYLSNAGSAAGAGIVGAGNALGQGLTNYWLMQQLNKPMPVKGGGVGGV